MGEEATGGSRGLRKEEVKSRKKQDGQKMDFFILTLFITGLNYF